MFADVAQDEPVVEAEPGFEGEVAAFNLFAYLSRSDVTWNPSVVSACKDSLYCPTTEEYILPVIHGNDRVEWFVQLSDEIRWEVEDRDTGAVRAKVVDEGGRRGGHAGRHPPPGLLAQAVDAAGLGERLARASRAGRLGQGPRLPGRLLVGGACSGRADEAVHRRRVRRRRRRRRRWRSSTPTTARCWPRWPRRARADVDRAVDGGQGRRSTAGARRRRPSGAGCSSGSPT